MRTAWPAGTAAGVRQLRKDARRPETADLRKPLTEPQKKFLRHLAHELKPVLLVGNAGVSDAVVNEAEQALTAHELIKARVRAGDRAERDTAIDALASATGAELVQRIGNVAVLYRPHPEKPRIVLPSRPR